MGTYIPLAYRSGVDHLFNIGFRVWNKAAFSNNYQAVPYDQVIANMVTGDYTYNNYERNENNEEVCFLTSTTNANLLSGAPTNAS